jgi:4-amino-4-deoxy-L-arabinose transferase-like glycosyltransferase
MLDSHSIRMSETPSLAEAQPSEHSYLRFGWAALILASLYVSYFSHLGAVGFVGPDEPRYASIAREMSETGDWVTPRLYGKPWFEKPILYYWASALGFKMFGVSEAAARLPSALAALIATLALAWLASKIAGWHLARWLLILLPTTVAMLGFAHAASPDMLFAAMLTCAIVSAAAALELVKPIAPAEPRRKQILTRYLYPFLFGFFLGAAALAKGPAAIILAGGAILLFAIFTKRWLDILRLLHPVSLASFLLTALPWYILCARRNPEFFRVFIVEHNFNRYLTPEFQHIQPFWYYLPITIAALLPWAFWLIWFASREGRIFEDSDRRTQILFLGCWAIFPILFFSLSKSKLPGYILPAVPTGGLVIAWSVLQSIGSTRRLARIALTLVGIFFLAVASGIYLSGRFVGSLVIIYVLIAGLGGLTVIFGGMLGRYRISAIFAALLFLILANFAYVSAERLDSQFSARSAAARIDQSQVSNAYTFKLQRGWHYQLNFYLHHEVPEWTPSVVGEAIVVAPQKNVEELKLQTEIVKTVSSLSPQAVILLVRPLAQLPRPAGSGQPR